MPKFPAASVPPTTIRDGVFSRVLHLVQERKGEIYPLHEGDTWLPPPEGCRMEDIRAADHADLNRYAPPPGMPRLIAAILERTRLRDPSPTGPENVLVTGGATAALGLVASALLHPGDEVLIPAPHWPLIDGIVRAAHGHPAVVPFFDEGLGKGAFRSVDTALAALDAHVSPRTTALYLNSPNNPTGLVLPRPVLEAMIEWARSRDLWILADEVYEDLDFVGESALCRPLAPERTFSVHSVSKGRGMAGYRCGYVIGPASVMATVRKLGTHSLYCAPRPSQIAAAIALGAAGDAWVREARAAYERLGRSSASILGAPPPQGSTFHFLDVADRLDERGLSGFLEDCAREGLLVAPGPSFGPYPTHIRVCFTSAPEPVLERGFSALARLLGRA